ncbi:beta-lactamase family protein [Sphingosinicellaceae bacterium]|nr:beta-lactamase family protein [Sphingosinicellaceae bacterium]
MRAFAVVVCALLAFSAPALAQPDPKEQVEAALAHWLAERGPIEKATGISAYVSFGDDGPVVQAFAGKVGRDPGDAPITDTTLFQMGSTTKSFTAAVILKLEAAGRLSLDDTVGKWLPEYPAWKNATIRSLLNMTSGIPNYSETQAMSRIWIEQPNRTLSAEDLVGLAYPAPTNNLPAPVGYGYSNTGYVLASMIATRAAKTPFRDLVHKLVIERHGLGATYYEEGPYPTSVMARLAHGYFANPACTDFQPGCKVSWNQRLVSRDVRTLNLSWAQAAGGAIATASNVDRWTRAVFQGKVVPPKQQKEWMELVSTKTGKPIGHVTPADPGGFALGLGQALHGSPPAHWFYEGMTLGYRTLYVWYAEENILITVQTNSQPPEGEDRIGAVVETIHDIVSKARPVAK